MAQFDTSFYNVRPRSVEEYTALADEADARKMSVQSNRLALILQQRQMDDADRARRAQDELQSALQGLGAGAKDEDVIGLLRGRGMYEQAGKMEASALERKAKQAEILHKEAQADKERIANGLSFLNTVGQIMGGVRDQASYDQARGLIAEHFGQDKAAAMPAQYNPQAVSQKLQQALSVKDRLEQEWKDKKYSLDVRQQSEVERNNRVQNSISQGNLGVAQANLGLSRERLNTEKAQPKGQYDAERGMLIDPRTGSATPVVGPDGKPLAPKSRSGPMSVTLQKELLESDDTVQAAANIVRSLEAAKKVNEKAYSGVFAKGRAQVMSNIGGSDAADATIAVDNLMIGQGLESLKSIFGAAPTEGERRVLMDMQASVDKTPKQRAEIMDRAIAAAQRRAKYASAKAKSIRSGSYLTEGAPVISEESVGGLSPAEQAELEQLRTKLGRK